LQPLGIVLDLTATLEGFLGLGAGGKNNTGAGDGQYGAHGGFQSSNHIRRHSGLATPKSASADFGRYVADLGKPESGGAPDDKLLESKV
jgi:hypothetical protein